ncbi:MAG: translation initiation factor [Balneolaceae bacterium]|nr:MAG: translation initiation factor [Balneolaceae bacterium]
MKVRIEESKNPRTGKPVTVIYDIIHNPQVIEKFAKKLKSACGAGGHVEGKTISIQGSHLTKVKQMLEKDGYEVNMK